MAVKSYRTLKGYSISINSNPLNEGGEGKVYYISPTSYYREHCAKIFHRRIKPTSSQKEKAKKRQYKIKYMIGNPPRIKSTDKVRICWPVDAIMENKEIIGFIMPLAFKGSKQLFGLTLSNINTSRHLDSNWKQQYGRSTNEGMFSRVQICTNIALAIYEFHKAGKYVIVDLKPPNLMVTHDAKVSLIDCDSIQITSNNGTTFYSDVMTLDYAPPEYSVKNSARTKIDQSWDYFSLAVIFYQILTGIHPYVVRFQGINEQIDTWDYKIKNAYFAHGNKSNLLTVVPELHDNYKYLPPELKKLFERAFLNDQYSINKRPRAEEWGQKLHYLGKYQKWDFQGIESYVPKNPPSKKIKYPNTPIRSAVKYTQNKKESHWWKPALAFVFWLVILYLIKN